MAKAEGVEGRGLDQLRRVLYTTLPPVKVGFTYTHEPLRFLSLPAIIVFKGENKWSVEPRNFIVRFLYRRPLMLLYIYLMTYVSVVFQTTLTVSCDTHLLVSSLGCSFRAATAVKILPGFSSLFQSSLPSTPTASLSLFFFLCRC